MKIDNLIVLEDAFERFDKKKVKKYTAGIKRYEEYRLRVEKQNFDSIVKNTKRMYQVIGLLNEGKVEIAFKTSEKLDSLSRDVLADLIFES